jgi:hypothetical protein
MTIDELSWKISGSFFDIEKSLAESRLKIDDCAKIVHQPDNSPNDGVLRPYLSEIAEKARLLNEQYLTLKKLVIILEQELTGNK